MTNISSTAGIFCNRTLNLRSIKAIGYDMDYTLIHYHVEKWETRAFEHLQRMLAAEGWPVEDLRFDPHMVRRGLVIDTLLGSVVKPNRFGFIKRAAHGTRLLDFDEQRRTYSRTIVDLSEPRWYFLNTLFSLSEGSMYLQLVDKLDRRELPGTLGYGELFTAVRRALDQAHMEGLLKAEILANPEAFTLLEPEVALALLDQHFAGKRLLLITNSDWLYASRMMSWAFDRFLPEGMTWRQLFEVVIVGARKPEFFTTRSPFFEVATEEGLLRASPGPLRSGVPYLGGSAREVEEHLGLSGDEILYVGDHIYGDVHVSKSVLRWRTALILRELEDELDAIQAFLPQERQLSAWMQEKATEEERIAGIRLAIQRKRMGYAAEPADAIPLLESQREAAERRVMELDQRIAPLARASAELGHREWGPLMRTGNDKSLLARQMERYADIYTSRVANFARATPFAFLRSERGSLPHDPGFPQDDVSEG